MSVENAEALMTVADVAARLKVSESQIYALVERGLLRCYRITTGKQGGIRIHEREHLEPYLKSVEQGGEPQEPPASPEPRQFRHLT
jgi:excisionase family DNA binding protein